MWLDTLQRLNDRLHDVVYERDAAELAQRGLYLDRPAWGFTSSRCALPSVRVHAEPLARVGIGRVQLVCLRPGFACLVELAGSLQDVAE